MRGEFIGVWSEARREIWQPLIEQPLNDNDEGIPEDIFCELFRVLAGDPKKPGALRATPSVEAAADILDDRAQSRRAFEATAVNDLAGERELVGFFEAAHDALEDLGGDALANRYFNLLAGFIEKFSLRYDLRRPCILCPTLPGMFTSLVRDLRALTSQEAHLDALMKDYEDAIRDLRFGRTDSRIRTCIGKQFMLLEGIGAVAPGVTRGTLGDMCDQLGSWPHSMIKEALKKLYGFASDYPGIRHGRTAKGALRTIDMRDMVAMSVLLTGFTPYLESRLSADAIFGGSVTHAGPIPTVAELGTGAAGASKAESTVSRVLRRLAFWRRKR